MGDQPQSALRRLSRRVFLIRAGVAAAGGAVLAACRRSARDSGGFGARIVLEKSADEIRDHIRSTRTPFFHAPGRFSIVEYPQGGPGAERYRKMGVLSDGLMALHQRCPHLGCRVPFCTSSQWFECPCHDSWFNGAGELMEGVSPRGLDRFKINVSGNVVTVDTGVVILGPARGVDTLTQAPQGPLCVETAGPVGKFTPPPAAGVSSV